MLGEEAQLRLLLPNPDGYKVPLFTCEDSVGPQAKLWHCWGSSAL